MSLNFTVQKVELFEIAPEGKFKYQLIDIDYYQGKWGNYNYIDWRLIDHPTHEGIIHRQKYQTEHESETVRKYAIRDFSNVCIEIGGLKEGDKPEKKDLLYKIGWITIRHKVLDNGKTFANIVDVELDKPAQRTPQDANAIRYGAIPIIPQTPTPSAVPLNDDIPF
jgi:hypothetical protein